MLLLVSGWLASWTVVTLRKKHLKYSIILIGLAILAVSSFARADSGVLGVWRDLNPSAYISPPANPPLTSVFMLNATEGWAVGDERFTTSPTAPINTVFTTGSVTSTSTILTTIGGSTSTVSGNFAFPAVLHYDGSTWNLVPVPKNPTEENDIPSGYALTSINFGAPGPIGPITPIDRDDGWAVGCGFDTTPPGPAPLPPPTCAPPTTGTGLITAMALHWDGVTWREQLSGLTGANAGPLESVFKVSPTDVWAVGADTTGTIGTFWHWTGVPGLGGGWTLQGTATEPLYSVFMVSPTEGWAVGAFGVIYHYFGGTWTPSPSPLPITACPATCPTLRSVFMVSPTEGWAVGDDGSVTAFPPGAGIGVIIHYAAGTWTGPVSPGTAPATLRSVFMDSSTEGWAVGDSGTIVHYTGGAWTKLPINLIPTLPATAFNFNSIFLNAANDAWSVGTAGSIMHYDGVNWGTVTSPSLTELTSISFGPPPGVVSPGYVEYTPNPDDGWAVGRATSSLSPTPSSPVNPVIEPTIIHWNGFMWTKGVAIGVQNDLLSVFMVDSGDVWTVGGGGHLGGSTTATCTVLPCPVILHYTGGSWNTVAPPAGSYVLTSVFMVNPDEGWAVGCEGTVDQCSPAPHTNANGEGSRAEPEGSGIILHYTVTGGVGTWAIFPSPTTPTALPPLNSIFMVSPNEGWAVGDMATVLHYTVTGGIGTWNVVAVGGLPSSALPPPNLNSVYMLSPISGWAVGGIPTGAVHGVPTFASPAGPIILYWDGTHWTRVATPTIPGGPLAFPPTLNSIYCSPSTNQEGRPTDCWTVGEGFERDSTGFQQLISTIFHWDGVSWTHITLAPSLLGIAPGIVQAPTLNSVYMITSSDAWVVGSPPTLQPPPNIFGGPSIATSPLSTILRFAPFGGVLTATSTSTVVSTVTTAITAITSSTTISPVCPGNVTISIKALDSQGNPVSGVNVVVTPVAPCVPTGSQTGVTNSQGIVTFTLPTGVYAVSASKNGASATQSITVNSSSGQVFSISLNISPGLIPGFPIESILAGIVLGLAALILLRRRGSAR